MCQLYKNIETESLGLIFSELFLFKVGSFLGHPVDLRKKYHLPFPGDFGGNAHRGTRWRSMQSFGGPFHSKIT